MMITLPARVYYGLIERYTSSTDQLMHIDHGEKLPDGTVRFELQPAAAAVIEPLMLPEESFVDAIERLVEIAEGRLS